MPNTPTGMGFGDFAKVLSGWTSNVIDTFTIDSGATNTNWPMKDVRVLSNNLKNTTAILVTGFAAGQHFFITSNTTNSITVSPNKGFAPNEGDIVAIINYFPEGQPVSVDKWGGNFLTGANITPNIQNLDLAITDLRDDIRGTGNTTLTDILNALGGDSGETTTIASNQDISGGVTSQVKDFGDWSLYLIASGAIDITVELSPNSGTDFVDLPTSPISFAGAGEDIIEMGYKATNIKLTGSNANTVTAVIRGTY